MAHVQVSNVLHHLVGMSLGKTLVEKPLVPKENAITS